MKGESDYEIQIIEGLLLVDWNKTKNLFFMNHYQISFLIHPTNQQPPAYVRSNMKVAGLKWCVEEGKFSPIVLRYNCLEILQQLKSLKQKCENSIVCSHGITSACVGICCILLMTKFSWSLLKTLQFLHSKIPILDFTSQETKCLLLYDQYLHIWLGQGRLVSWDQCSQIYEQAILARNTFLNSGKIGVVASPQQIKNITRGRRFLKKKVSFASDQKDIHESEEISCLPTKFSQSLNLKAKPKYQIQTNNQPTVTHFYKHYRTKSQNSRLKVTEKQSLQLKKTNSSKDKNKCLPALNKSILQNNDNPVKVTELEKVPRIYEGILKRIKQKINQKFVIRSYILSQRREPLQNSKRDQKSK